MNDHAEARRRFAAGRRFGGPLGLALLALPLLLAACTTTGGSGGPGPTLSSGCEDLLRRYMQERTPGYFVADVTGRACTYTQCPADVTNCRAAYPGQAIRNCESRSGTDCYVYATRRSIGWQGPPPPKPDD